MTMDTDTQYDPYYPDWIVYALFGKSDLLYIGITRNYHQRIRKHRQTKCFERSSIIHGEGFRIKQARKIEHAMICCLLPPMNLEIDNYSHSTRWAHSRGLCYPPMIRKRVAMRELPTRYYGCKQCGFIHKGLTFKCEKCFSKRLLMAIDRTLLEKIKLSNDPILNPNKGYPKHSRKCESLEEMCFDCTDAANFEEEFQGRNYINDSAVGYGE